MLRSVAGRLALPRRARRRFLEELAADLDGLYTELRAAGLPPAAARARAAQLLAPSDDALAGLSAVHRPPWLRLTAALTDAARRRGERVLLAAGVLIACAGGIVVPAMQGAFAVTRLGLPLVLLPAAAMLFLAGVKLVELLSGEARSARVRAGLGGLLVAAALAPALAGIAVLLDLRDTAAALAVAGAGGGAEAAPLLLAWVQRSATLLALALALALIGCAVWRAFVRRAAVLAAEERALLEAAPWPFSLETLAGEVGP